MQKGFVLWLGIVLGLGVAVSLPAYAAGEPTLDALDRRVDRLENIVSGEQIANLIRRINRLQREVRQLRGQIQRQAHRIDQMRERQRNLYADLNRRLRALELAQKISESNAGSGKRQPGAVSEGGTTASRDRGAQRAGAGGDKASAGDEGSDIARNPAAARKAYNAAFKLLKNARYDRAAAAFADVIERFPNGTYADNAQYWIGESHYVVSEFHAALRAFRKVIENYPDSAKAPDAKLKIGYTLYELGRYKKAREVLREVMHKYSESAVARLAEQRLLLIERRLQGSGQ